MVLTVGVVLGLAISPAGARACLGRTASPRRARLAVVLALLVSALTVLAARPVEAAIGRIPGGGVLRVSVPEAFGGKTVIGQLTVDQVVGAGFVTAYGCDDGMPTDSDGSIARSDLNYDAAVVAVRLEPADRQGRQQRRHLLLHAAAGSPDRRRQRRHLRYRGHVVRQPSHRHPRDRHTARGRVVACCACRFPRRSAARPSSANSPSTRSQVPDSSPPTGATTDCRPTAPAPSPAPTSTSTPASSPVASTG